MHYLTYAMLIKFISSIHNLIKPIKPIQMRELPKSIIGVVNHVLIQDAKLCKHNACVYIILNGKVMVIKQEQSSIPFRGMLYYTCALEIR